MHGDAMRDDPRGAPALPMPAPEPPEVLKTARLAYKPEEGPPDGRSEWWSMVRALLYGAISIAVIAALIFLWRA